MVLVVLFLKVFFALFAAVVSEPTASNNVKIIEKTDFTPQGWIKGAAADPSASLQFWLAIHREDPNQLHETVMDISTPGHSRYGKHLKRDELKEMLRPKAETKSKILNWLTAGGVTPGDIQDDGDWVKFDTNAEIAERLLATRFFVFQNQMSGVSKIRTLEYSVPDSVSPFVEMIQPTTVFGRTKVQNSLIYSPPILDGLNQTEMSASNPCFTYMTPDCLREMYGMGSIIARPDSANGIGVSGYLEQYAQYNDLELFLSKYAKYAVGANFSEALINNGRNTQDAPEDSTEANLDVQYALALSYNISVTYYSTAGRGLLVPDISQPTNASNSNEPYLEQLRYLLNLNDDEMPAVLTTSYGETEQSVPKQYAKTTCDLFAQLGARGVSIIFASGDTGPGSSCQTNDGNNAPRFNPIYPASCPYVTSIGGTYDRNPERAVRFSSGGFSDVFERPAYQEEAVSGYLSKLGNQWDDLYDPKGRAFPDIAAQGVNYAVYDKGSLKRVSGTSASAPTVAAIISHLNEVRISQGKTVLGFLNPWIYSKGYQGFTDIVDGRSWGCTGWDVYTGHKSTHIPYAGWNATEGWDPVTGFGTPDYQKLAELLP